MRHLPGKEPQFGMHGFFSKWLLLVKKEKKCFSLLSADSQYFQIYALKLSTLENKAQ